MVSSNMNSAIRNEKEADYRAVELLVREAFWNLHVPGCNEHFVMHNLRKSADFIPELDFVAETQGQIVGQIAYSRAVIAGETGARHGVVCFGPVSILPELQKQGIGRALSVHSIDAARKMGYPAILIYGDPRYYSRFGFRCGEKYDIRTADGKFAVALQALELKPGALNKMPGRFTESPAFEVNEAEFAKFEAGFPFKEKTINTPSQLEFRILASLRY